MIFIVMVVNISDTYCQKLYHQTLVLNEERLRVQ